MRVLYVSEGYTPHDYRFLTTIPALGHDVAHLMTERNGRVAETRSTTAISLGSVSAGSWPQRIAAFEKVVREFRPDVIHVGPIQTAAFTAVHGALNTPICLMSWGYDLLLRPHTDSVWRDVAGFVLQHASCLVADCAAVENAASLHGYAGPVVRLPWGVDIDKFKPRPKKPRTTAVVLSTRNWEPLYDVVTLAKAVRYLVEQGVDLELRLVGHGSLENEIKSILRPVEDAVTYLGYTPNEDLPAIYQDADLYVSTSPVDGSSISLLEAMATGLPVVVANIEGNREWVTPNGNGLLFEPGSVDDLANQLATALQQRERLATWGESSRSIAVDRADWSRNSPKLTLAYEHSMVTQ